MDIDDTNPTPNKDLVRDSIELILSELKGYIIKTVDYCQVDKKPDPYRPKPNDVDKARSRLVKASEIKGLNDCLADDSVFRVFKYGFLKRNRIPLKKESEADKFKGYINDLYNARNDYSHDSLDNECNYVDICIPLRNRYGSTLVLVS